MTAERIAPELLPKPSYDVLIFPAGSEIGIEILDALKYQKDIRVHGASSVEDHAQMLYRDLASDLPFFSAPDFVDRLNTLIAEKGIDFVYPARDDVQLFLMEHVEEIDAAIVSAPLETVAICRSKLATYEHLSGELFVPRTYTSPSEVDAWPIFAKPTEGEGSKGARLVATSEEMRSLAASGVRYAFCENLTGKEYTVDCFTGLDGELKVARPRTRDRIKAGIAVRSRTVDDPAIVDEVRAIAERINERLEFLGSWFFQLKARATGELVLLEASPRVPGTMGLTRNCGINYPLLTIYAMLGIDAALLPNAYEAALDKAFISRYVLDIDYDTVYVDYDDTLSLGAEVNCQAMAFLYQCRNQGKRVVLLTHHDDAALGELHADMAARGIAEMLFDEIVHLGPEEAKADRIAPGERAIFIDDSFRERSEVQRAHGIPVFDVSNVEALIDWTV